MSVHDCFAVSVGNLVEKRKLEHACVVDQDVDSTPGVDRSPDEIKDRAWCVNRVKPKAARGPGYFDDRESELA